MKDFNNPIATDKGLRAQMAYFSANKPILLTKMAIGSGRPSDLGEISQMSQLVKEEKEIPITQLMMDADNPCITVSGVVDYMEITTPFEVCELGLFILDPETDEETLYCYAYAERSELAPAKTHASELFNISTLISRGQEVSIPDYNTAPYVLRNEVNGLKAVVSADGPEDVYEIWLKPLGKVDGWSDWGDAYDIIGNTGMGQILNLIGAHFGIDPPERTDTLWIKPLDMGEEAAG